MPSASFLVISSLRGAVINSYLSLWLLYHFMKASAAEANDAEQMTITALIKKYKIGCIIDEKLGLPSLNQPLVQ